MSSIKSSTVTPQLLNYITLKKYQLLLRYGIRCSVLILSSVLIASCIKGVPIFVNATYSHNFKNNTNIRLAFAYGYNYPIDSSISSYFPLHPNEIYQMSSKKEWKDVADNTPADTILVVSVVYDTLAKYNYQMSEIIQRRLYYGFRFIPKEFFSGDTVETFVYE